MTAVTLLFASAIKTSLVMLIALAACALLRRQSAELRHWILSAALVCAAIVPPLGLVVPSWHLPLGAMPAPPPVVSAIAAVPQPARPDASPRAAAPRVSLAAAAPLLAAIWLAGAGISLSILAAGLARLTWIASRARRINRGPWVVSADRISREYRLRRPAAILQSDHPTLLATWGLVRPAIVLPRSAPQWTEGRAKVVLLHELAHIKRGDWVVQMLAEVLRAAYWFNPLVWIVCRRLRDESERAADDVVLNRGVAGSEYATHLLELARSFTQHPRAWLPATAIARPSSLERRIAAMLSSRVNRAPAPRSIRLIATAASFAVAIAIASAQGSFSTLSGSVFDPSNAALPDVTMVLTNAQSHAKYEIRSDRTGHFEFVGLPPGDYSLEAALPGFAVLRGTLTLAGDNVRRDVTLKIGRLQETITVTGGPSHATADRQPPPVRSDRARTFEPRPCTAPAAGGIGGNIRQPMKLVDVKPQYPPNLSAAGVGGTVVMDARLGTDGTVRDVQILSSSQPDLERAAVEAVRQWEFSQTLLNCVPVEVPMTVTINFVVQ